MTDETKEHFETTVKLTAATLQKLKDKGFRYVQVKGFTHDRHLDYMSPRYFMLIPIKELPNDSNKREIYEPINSSIISEWADTQNNDIEVLISNNIRLMPGM